MPLLQSKVDGTVAQSAVAISIRDVAIDVVGTPLRDVSFPCKELRQAKRPREASAVGVAFLLISKVDGTVAQCAVALSIRDVAIDVVGTPLRDVVVLLQGAPSGREAERGIRCRGGILASFSP
jgi:microcompartment protein CcmK/EutM